MMEKKPYRPRRLKLVLPALAAGLGAAMSVAAAPLAGDARAAVDRLLQAQTAGLPGKVSIRVEAPASGPLPACDALEPFLPRGAAAWGRVSVGLRCHSELKPWTRFVLAHVAVEGRYFVAARNIDTGQAFGTGDFIARDGDLTALPRSVVTDAAELQGVVAANRIASGAPLRRELMRGVAVIQQGQTIKVVAEGPGYVVSTEARAMASASAGATVRAKTVDGRMVSGVADEEGQIRLPQ
ncbi:flagellar basal body P-ring formation chaperone FlgA [Variovorax paradoxus]|uniref:Flagella basal body P-ring formation protein FlgA n=1 Tax=Variovorax paradoxus TaxID=34073 RepID=A0A0H2LU81_VARPD|nr:flagellar basal body P-ring formation chaperone FlgA [Variovorax paradoxus]KLN53808.1 flagella basal body P-ring formation protein FlgA precursor [Variovorax paradoxus]